MTERLPYVDKVLYEEVRDVLDKNLRERHIRGGNATKRKYESQRVKKEEKTLRKSLPNIEENHIEIPQKIQKNG